MQRLACLLASLLGLLMGSAFNFLRLGLFICFEVLIFLIYRNFLKIAHIGKIVAFFKAQYYPQDVVVPFDLMFKYYRVITKISYFFLDIIF